MYHCHCKCHKIFAKIQNFSYMSYNSRPTTLSSSSHSSKSSFPFDPLFIFAIHAHTLLVSAYIISIYLCCPWSKLFRDYNNIPDYSIAYTLKRTAVKLKSKKQKLKEKKNICQMVAGINKYRDLNFFFGMNS